LGNAWRNAFCVYILSVCTKLDVYLQGTLGKWFLLGSTSVRLQANVALALGFASSSCLRTCFTWKLGEMLNRQSLSCSWYKSAVTQHSIVFSFPDSCQHMCTRNQQLQNMHPGTYVTWPFSNMECILYKESPAINELWGEN
jgi:hypothetical protein